MLARGEPGYSFAGASAFRGTAERVPWPNPWPKRLAQRACTKRFLISFVIGRTIKFRSQFRLLAETGSRRPTGRLSRPAVRRSFAPGPTAREAKGQAGFRGVRSSCYPVFIHGGAKAAPKYPPP